jgi:uncharacterized protein YjbI with pentapeptide repeats
VGLDPSPPNGRPATDGGEAAPAAPALPKFGEKADDLEAFKKAVDDAAAVGGALWLSYLFVLFYLIVAAGQETHVDLFFERPVKLPFLNIELPLTAFFFVAPILFLIVHAYTLVHLVFLTNKTRRFNQALHSPEHNIDAARRENFQWQLPSNIFIQFLAGPTDVRKGLFGLLLRGIAWVTLVVAPVVLLLLLQIQFLPFHNIYITWIHRLALALDLALLWWLWRKILSGQEADGGWPASWDGSGIAFALALLVGLFSWMVATYPGEWQEIGLSEPDHSYHPGTLHDLFFNHTPFSNRLVLDGLNVYDGLNIVDPKNTEWRDFVFDARNRDLNSASFALATLPKVAFGHANLQNASFMQAQLQGASFYNSDLRGALLFGAQLQNASLSIAQLQGARLDAAQLQGALLTFAHLQGASLDDAHLQGASLEAAQLQGASLQRAQLQGATLISAQLQGATLDRASLQGAAINSAQLQGASLDDAILSGASLQSAQLQGATLRRAELVATDLSAALLWRADVGALSKSDAAELVDLRLPLASEQWLPVWKKNGNEVQPWDNESYQDMRKMMDSIPAGPLVTRRWFAFDALTAPILTRRSPLALQRLKTSHRGSRSNTRAWMT